MVSDNAPVMTAESRAELLAGRPLNRTPMDQMQMFGDDLADAHKRVERNADARWMQEAETATLLCAARMDSFTSCDVLDILDTLPVATGDIRALGKVFTNLKHAGLIVRTYGPPIPTRPPASDPGGKPRRRGEQNVWRSAIGEPT